MALMPGVTHRLIDASGSGRLSPNVVCVHTIVGRDPASAAHFSTGGYGEITQSRDTLYRSAANLNGNWRVIAIENEDIGAPFPAWDVRDGHAVPAFTAAQMEAIARILAWCHRVHGIPLVFVTDSRPTTRGVAFHRAGCDGNFAGYAFAGRVSGGELWSSAYGKVCPGDRRIFQLRDVIIPRARVLAGLATGGPRMATLDAEDLVNVATATRNAILDYRAEWPNQFGTYRESHQLWELLSHPYFTTSDSYKALGRIEAALAALQGELEETELDIVAAFRDPTNPADAEQTLQILAGVRSIVEADQDTTIEVGPEHLVAFAEAVAAKVPEHLRPVLGQAIAQVLTRGTEEYPALPPGDTEEVRQ